MKLLRALLARLYPHSLKMQMSLFVTVLFVMTTGLVGVMLVYSIQLKMRDTLVTQQYTLVESVADKLEQEIEIRRDALRHATLSVENGATSDGDQARHFLTGQLVLQTLFDRLHMFNAETLPIATYPQDPDRPGTETANYAFAESTLLTGYRLVSTPYQSIWREEHL
ncbi:MAG TPA: hypothetical protein VJU83_06660, partial [Burkholderiales bacterium]|nr:hypothetical protein [Burkholderiales bacterium]